MQARGVEPVDPFQGRELDFFDGPPGPAGFDQFGLVGGVHGLCEGVVVGVADGADRPGDAQLGKAVRIGQRHVLGAAIRVVHESLPWVVHEGGHVQCLQRQRRGRQRTGHGPADDSA